jgi:hypothetical protein
MDSDVIVAWIILVLAEAACRRHACGRSAPSGTPLPPPRPAWGPPSSWRDRSTGDNAGAAAVRAVRHWLLTGWLLAALALLGMNGRLPLFIAWMAPATLLAYAVCALVRQQLAPSICDRPPLPARYRAADDLLLPLTEVVAVAEREAEWRP